MGMAASQGRLLFMTARISNNEFEQQCVAYSKQRLADDSQTANDQYLDALQETQYQLITGYNGDTAQYEAVSYNVLTGFNNVASSKQYIVSDNVGRIIVSDSIAQAFENSKHNYNAFLATVDQTTAYTQIAESDITEGMVHDAWDRYLISVGKGHQDGMYIDGSTNHILGFNYNFAAVTDPATNKKVADPSSDYVTYNSSYMNIEERDPSGNGTGVYRRMYLAYSEEDGRYYVENYKINVESYIDQNGDTQYAVYFIASDTPQFDANGNINNYPQEDDGKYYINDLKVVPIVDSNGNNTYKLYTVNGHEVTDNEGNVVNSDEIYINKYRYLEQGYVFTEDENGINNGTSCFTGLGIHALSSNFYQDVSTESNVIFFEGATKEQRELYDYAVALTRKYAAQYNVHGTDSAPSIRGQHNQVQNLVYDADKVQYYTNIFNEMTTKGYTTYSKMIDDKYINTEANLETKPFASDEWLIRHIKQGKFVLSYFSTADQQFIKTTLDDDESIVNKESKQKMAIAEQVYQSHMDRIQAEDKKFDMELTKLESEHTALLTEYDSVAKVISKNVEKSFGIFNA